MPVTQQRPDLAKMTFEQLQEYLEHELPYFAFSIHTFGPRMPVNIAYRHQHRGLTEYGMRQPFGALGGTYGSATLALRTVAERYHAHLDEVAKKTAEAARHQVARQDLLRAARPPAPATAAAPAPTPAAADDSPGTTPAEAPPESTVRSRPSRGATT